MMTKLYAGLCVGLISLLAGVLGGSLLLVVLGVIATPVNATLVAYFRRRRRDGYRVA